MEFSENMLSQHLRPINGSAIRAIFHLLGKPGMISFAGGNPAASALEPDVIAEISSEVLKQYGWVLLQYGATEGFAPLRESIAQFVQPAGVNAEPSHILPTQGSGQALDLLVKATCDEGDVVLVESPTFLGALQTFETYGVKLVALPSDEMGVIPEEAEKLIVQAHPKIMYLIPTFQNPTGKTLPLERREKMAALAEKYGVILAEDDPYRDLRYAGEALRSIKSFDKAGWVVYLGSFSKLISPGLRVGYAVVDQPLLMRKMVIGKQSTDLHSPLLNQAIVDAYLRKGLMPEHLGRICASYKAQLDLMLKKMAEFPAGTHFTHPQGGLFLWAELPEGIDAVKMLDEAVARNVAYVPGTHFYAGGGHERTLRLNFSNSTLADIDKGMSALGELVREKCR
ncbi:MAG: PLP-dependent aminotransferase family protein [Clostridia bacterium]